MEFAQPLLLLTRWKLNTFQITPPANQAEAPSHIQHIDGAQAVPSACGFNTAYANVFSMRKVRTRATSKRQQIGSADAPCATQCSSVLDDEDRPLPLTLKIVQPEPRKQPECLLISGRMADVCAALERMARNERALHA